MTEQAIIDRVQDIIQRAWNECVEVEAEEDSSWFTRLFATRVVLELGLEEERQGPRFYRDRPSLRYATPWRSID